MGDDLPRYLGVDEPVGERAAVEPPPPESCDDGPFTVLGLRGRSRKELLDNLGARRGGAAPGAGQIGTPGFRRSPRSWTPSTPHLIDRPAGRSPAAVAVDSLLDQVPLTGIIASGHDLVDLLRRCIRHWATAIQPAGPDHRIRKAPRAFAARLGHAAWVRHSS
jgi:hypothetical protein